MNHYLIWTDTGWLKTPTYTQHICTCTECHESEVNTTQNIRSAYKFSTEQVKESFRFLQRYGVASWIIEYRDDMMEEIWNAMKGGAK